MGLSKSVSPVFAPLGPGPASPASCLGPPEWPIRHLIADATNKAFIYLLKLIREVTGA